MSFYKASDELMHNRFLKLKESIESNAALVETKYVDLGVKKIRVLNYAQGFTPLMKKQITWSLKDHMDSYDVTMVIWNEKEILHDGVETEQGYDLQMNQVFSVAEVDGVMWGYDKIDNTYYYGVRNLDPEEFIKLGHIFVNMFYRILKTSTSNLVHGACVGIDGKGVLLCARGQRGKSTLSVLAMMDGFDYVSDDYLVLEKSEKGLLTYPIYSIITLSPTMYNELYDELEGTRFISNNARRDKYVINIANFHDRFRSAYPVNVCMFPEIVSDPEPSIIRCSEQERGRAIIHLAHSTMMQMGDTGDPSTSRKIMSMVSDKEFYKIRLCRDIRKNVALLKEFIKQI